MLWYVAIVHFYYCLIIMIFPHLLGYNTLQFGYHYYCLWIHRWFLVFYCKNDAAKNALSWCEWTTSTCGVHLGVEYLGHGHRCLPLAHGAKQLPKVVVPMSLLPVQRVFPLPRVLVTPSCRPSFSFLPFCWSAELPHRDFILYLPAKFHVFIGYTLSKSFAYTFGLLCFYS